MDYISFSIIELLCTVLVIYKVLTKLKRKETLDKMAVDFILGFKGQN